MTDNEIIKDLQEEIHLIEYVNGDYSAHASLEMLKGCLDLINRLQTEIETTKVKAIREFSEKFKDKLKNLEAKSYNKAYQTGMQDMLDYYVPKIIDDLLKEMG